MSSVPNARDFTTPVETYTVLILRLQEYVGTRRALPEGFAFCPPEQVGRYRAQEKKLLRALFEDWELPYCRRLPGFRADSPVWVVQGTTLVGGVFLHDRNEFDADPQRGQLHYAFMDARYKGLGLYSVMFREVVTRAQRWGLQALYLNSDRYLLPDVYLRWGARPLKVIEKSSRLGAHSNAWVRGMYAGAHKARRELREFWLTMRPPCE